MNPLAGPAGPGKYSTRTDNLQMGSTAYGEGKETDAINTGAPKATTRGIADNVGGRPVGAPSVPMAPLTGIYEKTQNPNEPISAGIDIGPGPGSSALGMTTAPIKTSDILAKMLPFDSDGSIAILYQQAIARGE